MGYLPLKWECEDDAQLGDRSIKLLLGSWVRRLCGGSGVHSSCTKERSRPGLWPKWLQCFPRNWMWSVVGIFGPVIFGPVLQSRNHGSSVQAQPFLWSVAWCSIICCMNCSANTNMMRLGLVSDSIRPNLPIDTKMQYFWNSIFRSSLAYISVQCYVLKETDPTFGKCQTAAPIQYEHHNPQHELIKSITAVIDKFILW